MKNGFTQIDNETLEALARTRITGEARQVFDAIMRKTYGWHRKHTVITYKELREATGMQYGHIYRAIQYLLKNRLITKSQRGYAIQKNHKKWISHNTTKSKKETKNIAEDTPHMEYETYSTHGVGNTPHMEYETYSTHGVFNTPHMEYETPSKALTVKDLLERKEILNIYINKIKERKNGKNEYKKNIENEEERKEIALKIKEFILNME